MGQAFNVTQNVKSMGQIIEVMDRGDSLFNRYFFVEGQSRSGKKHFYRPIK